MTHPSWSCRLPALVLAVAGVATLAGCHSAFVQATVINQTGAPIRIFELDYPGASFGSGELAPGAQFHYRFKILGTGDAKISWTDQAGQDHIAKGPEMHDGQEGTLAVTLGAKTAAWDAHLRQAP